jgi:hypothetical protein
MVIRGDEMALRLHSHRFVGTTTYNDRHRHNYMGTTSVEPDTPEHTHAIGGATSVDDRHSHRYRLRTSPPVTNRRGRRHSHRYEGPTEFADGHIHFMRGSTSID